MCGALLVPETPEPREERKVVTVVFVDLVGFTARAEQLDPEDVRALLAPYHARLRAELERHGGTVEKFIGDAVMALFGAPVVHEDDPERAVRAAIAIRDWVRDEEDLELRIAVNTGEALIRIGAAEGEGMASGDVVNTAARLQTAAPVNGILVGETTHRATSHAIEYREAEPVEAKGKAKPIPVWEAIQPRARLGVDLAPRGENAADRPRARPTCSPGCARPGPAERAVQLVTLVGEPGIGKSRLVFELMQVVEADPELITLAAGPLAAVRRGLELLGSRRDGQGGGGDSRNRLARGGRREGARRGRGGHSRGGGGQLGRGPPAGAGRDRRRGRARRRARGRSRSRPGGGSSRRSPSERPLVLVFEDLHCADDSLLDFVDHLVDWASGVPILVLCDRAPRAPRAAAGLGRRKAQRARLWRSRRSPTRRPRC